MSSHATAVHIVSLTIVTDISEPLRRLIVDEMEEDGSGMLQSLSDSDTITADLA